MVLSQPILGERPDARRAGSPSVVGFAGILVLLRPGSAVFHPAAVLLIGTALFNALVPAADAQAHRRQRVHDALLQRARGRGRLTLALPWGFEQRAPLTGITLGLLLLTGLLAGTAHWLITRAFLIAPASLLTPFTYVQMVWATLFGYLVFAQLPDRWSFVGMAIIVGSGVMLALRRAPARAAACGVSLESHGASLRQSAKIAGSRMRSTVR